MIKECGCYRILGFKDHRSFVCDRNLLLPVKPSVEHVPSSRFKIKGQPIDDNKLYKLVTYDYLANGGDNLTLLTQSVSRINYPQRMREGLIEYVSQLTKEGKEVNAVLDGRIKIN